MNPDIPRTSSHPVIAEINEIVYRIFPPKPLRKGGFSYGPLYYYSTAKSPEDALWMLDGMTPVRANCVLQMLQDRGVDVAKFRAFFAGYAAAAALNRQVQRDLRESAKKKLTPEEAAACGL